MSSDDIKPPDSFPSFYYDILNSGVGSHALFMGTRNKCLIEARRFRSFVRSIKHYPLHKANNVLDNVEITTRTKRVGDDIDLNTVYINILNKIKWRDL